VPTPRWSLLTRARGVDALSQVLAPLQLRAAAFVRIGLRPPWGVRIPEGRAATFHAAVSGGGCLFRLDGSAPVALLPGEVVVLPHGHGHTICDSPGSPLQTMEIQTMRQRAAHPSPPAAEPDAAVTAVICGQLWFHDGRKSPLLNTLPAAIHFGDASPGWLSPMLSLVSALDGDSPAPGGEALLARLGDVILIQAIRAHLARLPSAGPGVPYALNHPQLAAALDLIHRRPEMPWTVARLASRVGLSRSSFAVRFAATMGEAPGHYLTRWRMSFAARQLAATSASMREIAEGVGYRTEAALSRAFKHWSGVAPGEYRRRARAP
jgi:AraC-like DNA-binding protein